MHESQLRRIFQHTAFAAAFAIAGTFAPSVAAGQDTGVAGTTQSTSQDDDDDGTDYGWIGLLGLAGLLGLRRRDHEHHVVDTTTTRRPVT